MSKSPEHQVVQSCQHRASANANSYPCETDSTTNIRAQQPALSIGIAAKSISETSSHGNLGSQLVNLSDHNTEPPGGWPKLSDLPSPVLKLQASNAESEKDKSNDKSVTDAGLGKNHAGKHVVSPSPSTNRRSETAPSNTSLHHTASLSPVRLLASRRSRSPASFPRKIGSEPGKLFDKPVTSSEKSIGRSDAPSRVINSKEAKRPFPDAQVLSRKKKRTGKRKNDVPKRRRPASQNRSNDPRFTHISEKSELEKREYYEEAAGFEDSPPPNYDDGHEVQPHSVKLIASGGTAESNGTSITQKSREQDTDGHSAKDHERATSPGSVVIGSSSYDGCSLDVGCGRTNGTGDDIPSRPSSIVWNDSLEDSTEGSSPNDQQVPRVDALEETEVALRLEPSRPPSQQHSRPTDKQDGSSICPDSSAREQHGEHFEFPSKRTASVVTQERLEPHAHLKASAIADTCSVFSGGGKAAHPIELKGPTQSACPLAFKYHDQSTLDSHPSSGTSPVSPEEHSCPLGNDICRNATGRRNSSNSLVEANVDEMIVCITSFPKEIESELAHELVMRLGGEVVYRFDTAPPHCVVAPVDLQTKEATSSEMAVLLALASRIPVVGMSWLTHCFKSGFWVDFSNFETPSSKVKPSTGVFRGIAATFEDAFSRKNAKRKCVEYRKFVEKLITLADGVVVDTKGIKNVRLKENKLRLHIQIAYDFENNAMSTAPKARSDTCIPTCVVSQTWISACLFSGQCPPP